MTQSEQHDVGAINAGRSAPLLSARGIGVQFDLRVSNGLFAKRHILHAVNGVDLDIASGETLAIVGESGCGKSTLARALVGLAPPNTGEISWQGRTILKSGRLQGAWPRRDIQMIFQDPLASLNPRMTVFKLIAEPLRLYEPALDAAGVSRRVHAVMEKVGLNQRTINRYPHEFSGGQCQRIGIARALVCAPKLLVCDEAVSALDVSIRAQIVNLLIELQRELGLALIFIAHDLAIVRHIADRVMVMYLGRCVELADKTALYTHPAHPYTQMLLAAVPVPDPSVARARVHACRVDHSHLNKTHELPSPFSPLDGCTFHARCVFAMPRCSTHPPQMHILGASQCSRCHLHAE